jgi:DNA-binding response OmpR family regulator
MSAVLTPEQKGLMERLPLYELLRDKNNLIRELEDRIAYLESQLQEPNFLALRAWKLSPSEAKILKCLVRRELMTRDNAMALLYSARGGDEPHDKIIDVFIARLRSKLKADGITIITHWGQGWYLPPQSKVIVRRLCCVSVAEDMG